MPRYLVERTFPEGLEIPTTEAGPRRSRPAPRSNQSRASAQVFGFMWARSSNDCAPPCPPAYA